MTSAALNGFHGASPGRERSAYSARTQSVSPSTRSTRQRCPLRERESRTRPGRSRGRRAARPCPRRPPAGRRAAPPPRRRGSPPAARAPGRASPGAVRRSVASRTSETSVKASHWTVARRAQRGHDGDAEGADAEEEGEEPSRRHHLDDEERDPEEDPQPTRTCGDASTRAERPAARAGPDALELHLDLVPPVRAFFAGVSSGFSSGRSEPMPTDSMSPAGMPFATSCFTITAGALAGERLVLLGATRSSRCGPRPRT